MAGLPVPLRMFAEQQLGVRQITRQVVVNGQPSLLRENISSGHDDEVWLKVLEVRHPNERHTVEDWQKLIDRYRSDPAHPDDPRYNPPVL